MSENSVKISIEALDKFKDAFQQFNSQLKSMQDNVQASSSLIGKSFDLIKTKWVELLAAYGAMRGTIALVEMGAKAEQVKDSFHTVTESMKVDGQALIAEMKRVSYVFVDETDLMIKAQRALVQGLSPDQIIALTEAARVASRYMAVSVSEAFDRILDAVMNLQTRGLKGSFHGRCSGRSRKLCDQSRRRK